MKRFILVACCVLAALALPLRASAQTMDSPKADLILTEPLVIGTTVVPAGDYRMQCRMIDGKHFLVITQFKKEVVRVPCEPETLAKKVKTTDYTTFTRPDKSKALTSVRIRGEMVAHNLVTN